MTTIVGTDHGLKKVFITAIRPNKKLQCSYSLELTRFPAGILLLLLLPVMSKITVDRY